jgi:hypothetical protein
LQPIIVTERIEPIPEHFLKQNFIWPDKNGGKTTATFVSFMLWLLTEADLELWYHVIIASILLA